MSEDYRPRPAEIQAMVAFVDAVPVLRPALEEHLSDHQEVLSRLLMADFGRAFVGAGDQTTIAALLSQIERLASSTDPGLTNVVPVTFIETYGSVMPPREPRWTRSVRSSDPPQPLR